MKSWIIGAMAGALMAAPALADPRPPDSFFERVDEMVAWIGENSDYPGELSKPLAVAFLPRPVLNYIFFETAENASYSGQSDVKALYLERGIMLLPDDFELGEHDYILLHELVHHIQWEQEREFACLAEREREAYDLQVKWVEETGVGRVPSPLFLMMLRCSRY
jgi:hypothetical protein